jgi:hypothetical protein
MGSRSTKGKDIDTSMDDRPFFDEGIWQAWVQKGKLREEETARRLKKLARIFLPLFVVGAVFCLLVVR